MPGTNGSRDDDKDDNGEPAGDGSDDAEPEPNDAVEPAVEPVEDDTEPIRPGGMLYWLLPMRGSDDEDASVAYSSSLATELILLRFISDNESEIEIERGARSLGTVDPRARRTRVMR